MSTRALTASRLFLLLFMTMTFVMASGCSMSWKFWKKKKEKRPPVERVEKLQPRSGYPAQ